MSTVLHVSIE